MSPQSVTDKIIQEAEIRVREIREQAELGIKELQSKHDATVARLREQTDADIEKRKQQIELVAAAKARQQAELTVQAAERNALNTVFDTVISSVAQSTSSDYISFFVAHAKALMPEHVVVDRVDCPAQRLHETNEVLTALGFSASLSDNNRMKAGLILYTNDGVYDITLERIVDNVRTALEMQIMSMMK